VKAPGTLRRWIRPIFFLSQNPISLAGVILTTSSAITLIAFWFYFVFLPGPPHPYLGILIFLTLPAVFVVGLLLIPAGMWLQRRRMLARGETLREYPQVDFSHAVVRRGFWFVCAATFTNFVVLGTASYKSVNFMDSTEFCGQTCHTVMTPEFTAYQNSPHSRVECVACHIGAGASWFVRSKLSGTRQLFAVAFHTYSRPIPSPVKYLRPARETCEQCHWPQRFTGDKFVVKQKFQDDEKNTKVTTVLLLKVGGVTWQGREGIHGRHLETASRIHYISTDPERTIIPVVEYVNDSGKTITFVSTDIKTTPEQLAKGERREMDCVDCHNRPTHSFDLPEGGVDKQMASGRISPELPFMKKEAVELLKATYPDRDTARLNIVRGLDDFYRTSYPQVYATRRALIQQSAEELAAIYLRNVFPEMRVTWGTHPNNIGHMDSPGCFRCHDGSHTSADGQTIPNDCSTCHSLLAMEEPNPKILTDLGMQPPVP